MSCPDMDGVCFCVDSTAVPLPYGLPIQRCSRFTRDVHDCVRIAGTVTESRLWMMPRALRTAVTR